MSARPTTPRPTPGARAHRCGWSVRLPESTKSASMPQASEIKAAPVMTGSRAPANTPRTRMRPRTRPPTIDPSTISPMCPRDTWSGFARTLDSLTALVGSDTGRRNRVDRCREHGGFGFGLCDAAALDCCAGGVHDRSDDREVPGDGEIAPEDALFLAAFDQRLYLVEHGDVTPVEFLHREPGGVEREQAVELRELPPGGAQHSLQRLRRLAAVGLGASHRLDDLCGCVLHDGVEKIRTCRKVHVDGRSDDACAASDLRHAAVGIARQRFETSGEDGRDAAFRVGAAAPGGGRFGRCS